MRDYLKFYIDGQWVQPARARRLEVIDPATDAVAGRISLGTAADADRAVAAARTAFTGWARSTRAERIDLLNTIAAAYARRAGDIAEAITAEMGAPVWLAKNAQAPSGLGHLKTAAKALESYAFEEAWGSSRVVKEPIGVCAFITPWNWPMNQITAKVAPALAMGCAMVLKPSEIAPFSAYLFAEIMHEAGAPAGVFNLVNGEGPVVGAALAAHPEVDMVSITGSTRAGADVARNAAATIKRVHQELGGKSPNIILPDADLPSAIKGSVAGVMMNSGQSCSAPTRMIVPADRMEEVAALAKAAADDWLPGDPNGPARMGPVVSQQQWDRVQGYIRKGLDEGARLVAGGPGRPEGLETGYYVKPTIFADVRNDMAIAREEIFGPVLAIIPYETQDEAVAIANDTDYGLAGYVYGADLNNARDVARRIRAGYVTINNARMDLTVPFGGYKRSGNGREFGDHAFADYVELKSLVGYGEAD